MAGLVSKNKEFWEKVRKWDIVIMSETWIEEKGWERVKERLPEGYTWKEQTARREHKKGRAKGGMLVGIREGIGREKKVEVNWIGEGLVEIKMDIKKERWTVIGVYAYGNLEGQLKKADEWEDNEEKGRLKIMGGISTQGLEIREDGEKEKKREGKRKILWRIRKGERC